VTRWHPRLELARLLEALSEGIIAATDEEVRQMHGRPVASTAREVRSLVKAARADRGGGAIADRDELGVRLQPDRPLHLQRH
jgi:hypothetical protein